MEEITTYKRVITTPSKHILHTRWSVVDVNGCVKMDYRGRM
jgi:hypothetical protein